MVALLGALALAVGLGPAAWAAGGQSTPGVTVTAQNPGTSGSGSDVRLTLTAHSEASSATNPSCRPQDANIDCWGNLVLRIPEAGGLTLKGLQVHRVAVGDTTCGGEDESGCGDEMAAALRSQTGYPVTAQVNGLSTITDPGNAICPVTNTACPVGTQVQVLMTLTNNGPQQYRDTVTIDVNQFVSGPDKPTIWQGGPLTVQQVQIHFADE